MSIETFGIAFQTEQLVAAINEQNKQLKRIAEALEAVVDPPSGNYEGYIRIKQM